MNKKKKGLIALELITLALTTTIGASSIKGKNKDYVSKIEHTNINEEMLNDMDLEKKYMITANSDVNLRKGPSTDSEKVGLLKKNNSASALELLPTMWYKVLYNGEECYVSADYVTESIEYTVKLEKAKYVYVNKDTKMLIPSDLVEGSVNDIVDIPKNEVGEICGFLDDKVLIKTNEYFGYVNKSSVESLYGTFVVVDISDQELKLYVDNEVVLTSPIVSGGPGHRSDEGKFKIYQMDENRYLRGPGYCSYVDVFMPYNGGEGLHDAEYHTNEDGRHHGWRGKEEFGGDTYLNNGSHGCINMLNDDVMKVKSYVNIGTPVIVKK